MTVYIGGGETTVEVRSLTSDTSPRPSSGQIWPRFAAALWPPQTPGALFRNLVTPGGA